MQHSCVLLAALLLFGSPSAFSGESPVRTVEGFYDWAIHKSTPASNSTDESEGIAAARQFLGQELFAALEAQRAYEKACVRLVPKDIKGHMLDQSPFFLQPDAVGALLSTKAVVKGDTARVYAKLTYAPVSDSAENQWTDTVVLGRRDQRWVILNIEWQDKGSLTQRLVEFANYRCKPESATRARHAFQGTYGPLRPQGFLLLSFSHSSAIASSRLPVRSRRSTI